MHSPWRKKIYSKRSIGYSNNWHDIITVIAYYVINYPGKPPLSIWFANVTSSLQTSNCHFRKPSTPHNTFPVCIPIRISTLNPVASRTNLKNNRIYSFQQFKKKKKKISFFFPYLIASIICNPIVTQLYAWFGREMGNPETQ